MVKQGWWIFSRLGEMIGVDVVNAGIKTENLTDFDVLKTIKGSKAIFETTPLAQNGFAAPPISMNIPSHWVTNKILPDRRCALSTETLNDELERFKASSNRSESSKGKFQLISMREKGHLNSQFISVEGYFKLPRAYINPKDASICGLIDGQKVFVSNENGKALAIILITNDILCGTVAIPHGHPNEGNISLLTSDINGINPLSGMVSQSAIFVLISDLVK